MDIPRTNADALALAAMLDSDSDIGRRARLIAQSDPVLAQELAQLKGWISLQVSKRSRSKLAGMDALHVCTRICAILRDTPLATVK